MIDVLPTSHSAIFARPPRRIPPSLILAIVVAGGLHALLIFYLITQNFVVTAQPEVFPTDNPVIVTMDKLKPVTDPKPKPPNTITAHPPLQTIPDKIDTAPIIPVKGPDVVIDTGPPVLPTGGEGPVTATGTDAGPVYVTPRWTSFPDSNALADYYPPSAINDDRTGQASVECTVLDTAGHISCVLVSETPKGYGFGSATVRVVQDKGRVDTGQGAVKPGSKLRATLKWQLGDG